MNLFRKKQETTPDFSEELGRLEEKLQQLEKKEKWLQSKIDAETRTALENKTSNKKRKYHIYSFSSSLRSQTLTSCERVENKGASKFLTKNRQEQIYTVALNALERRKKLQSDMDQCKNLQLNLMSVKSSVSNAIGLKEEMQVYKEAQAIFKRVTAKISVEEVEATKDELQEEMQKVTDIRNALSSRLDDGVLIDEDDLERELEDLGREILDEQEDELERELKMLSSQNEREVQKALLLAPAAPKSPIKGKVSRTYFTRKVFKVTDANV